MHINFAIIFKRLKYLRNWILKKIFSFHPWHVSSFESRPYCVDLIDYMNNDVFHKNCVVELGCGLGETLSKVNSKKRIGFDISAEVISAANLLNCFNNTQFKVGSFNSIRNMKIDYLIAVNFLHDFESHQVKIWFEDLITNNQISHIVVDELTDQQYFCLHDWKNLLPNSYKETHCIENNYNSGRSIKIFLNSTSHA